MSSVSHMPTIRMIATSFAAGVGAMVLAGLVAPVALQGGLSIRDAMATAAPTAAPVLEPIDVVAVQAQLAEAERTMQAGREATESAIRQIDQLAAR
jgi:hypothetical protein